MNVLDLPRGRPFRNSPDLVFRHGKTGGRHDVTEILYRIDTPFALFGIGEKFVLPELPKDFPNVFLVRLGVVGIDEDIVEIDDDIDINHVREDFIDESLPCGRSISETEGHDVPFVGTPSGAKGSLPFIALIDPDEMVGMFKVDFGVDSGFAGSIQ